MIASNESLDGQRDAAPSGATVTAPARSRGPSVRRFALAFAVILLALVGLVLWLEPSSSGPTYAVEPGPAEARPAHTTEVQLEYAADGIPIKPTDLKAPVPEGPMHPHPITKAHERIYRENNLVGALNLAVDVEDALRIRELVAQYRAEYPKDENRLQAGYEIIADCLDRPDEVTRARALRFWETELRSQTRRYVRRYCLEGSERTSLRVSARSLSKREKP